MNPATLIRVIAATHLLQPPLTMLLGRQLRLKGDFEGLPPLAAQIARNMAIASVALPTSCGLIVGLCAEDVVRGDHVRALAWMLASFWAWRLSRQMAIGALLPRGWHWSLLTIFTIQGPAFALLLVWTAAWRR